MAKKTRAAFKMRSSNSTPFKHMGSSPVKGKLDDLISNFGVDLKSLGDRAEKWKEKRKEKSQEKGDDGLTNFERHWQEKKSRKAGESKFQADVRRKREKRAEEKKDYKKRTSGIDPSNKTKMVNVVVDGVVKSVPAEDRFKYESVKRVKSTPKNNNKKKKKVVKPTKLSASGTEARRKEYDAKGWQYDDTIKGYNRDGTKKKKKVKKVITNEEIDAALNKYTEENPAVIVTPTVTEEKSGKKKGFDYSNNKFDYSSPIEKKSPYEKGIGKYAKKAKGKRGYKMKRK